MNYKYTIIVLNVKCIHHKINCAYVLVNYLYLKLIAIVFRICDNLAHISLHATVLQAGQVA
jgi:hypothetical protein